MLCTHSTHCDLYVQFAAEPALALWKKHYCNRNYQQCARFICASRREPVPMTLLPNGVQLGAARDDNDITLTAIFNAISKNRCNMVRSIIKANPGSQNSANSNGVTALMFAAKLGNYNMIKLLLELGCDASMRDKKRRSALDIATHYGYEACAGILRTAEHKSIMYGVGTQTEHLDDADDNKESLFSRMLHFLRGHKPVHSHEKGF